MSFAYIGLTVLTATMLAAPAVSGQNQSDLQRRVSINVNAVTPRQVLEMIARAVDCTVTVDPKVIQPVTIRVSRVTARTALNAVCESVGCRWRLDGRTLRVDVEQADTPQPDSVAEKSAKPRLSDPLPSGEPVYTIGDGVTAPVVVKEERPQYTRAAMKAKIQGEVAVEFVVRRDGTVTNVRVTKSLSPDLDERSAKAVQQWLFTPGQLNGRPVAVRVEAQLTFTLR